MNFNNDIKPNFIIGFGGNPEFNIQYNSSEGTHKLLADTFDLSLSGGAVTVAKVVTQLSQGKISAKLLIATSRESNWRDMLLDELLKQYGMKWYERIPIRQSGRTGIACQLINKQKSHSVVIGDKGSFLYEPLPSGVNPLHLLNDHISEYAEAWRIAVGVLPDEVKMLQTFYHGKCAGKVLNPRLEMAKSDKLLLLLNQIDMLFWNEQEFTGYLNKNVSELKDIDFLILYKKYKIPIMVVTRNSNGASLVYFGKLINIASHKVADVYSDAGAGDWWLGSFLAYIFEHNQVLKEATESVVVKAANYASVASGLKVRYKNGNLDGPDKQTIENTMKQR